MTSDERAIRELLATWNRATLAGDIPTVLGLMTEDALFFGPGREPIRGREEFAALAGAGSPFRMEIDPNIGEIVVSGDMASAWTHLAVTITPREGAAPIRRAGYTLTLFRRTPNGNWLLSRDANMMTVVAE